MKTDAVKKSYVSKMVMQLQPSGIRKFFDLASQMEGVISLGVGEPDFITPWNVCEASVNALENGYTGYTSNAGLLELREEISAYLKNRFQLSYHPNNEMLITVGASQAIDVALRTILDPGDEVIVVEPCFVAYAAAVSLAGGVPVSAATSAENEFKLLPENLENKITEKTKALILCFPNNPTGATMVENDLAAIAEIVKKHDLLVLTDEIYAELNYDEEHVSIAAFEGMKERTIYISGFSKAFAMTGWRLGYAAGPQDLIEAMLKIHQYTVMCAPTMAQHGALEALRNGMDDVAEMVKSYRQRRNFLVQSFQEIGLDCHMPGGAFYVFPSIKRTGLTSEQFAEQLLHQEKVAVVPGHVFGQGGEGHIRCSYASSLTELQEAIHRIARFLKRIDA